MEAPAFLPGVQSKDEEPGQGTAAPTSVTSPKRSSKRRKLSTPKAKALVARASGDDAEADSSTAGTAKGSRGKRRQKAASRAAAVASDATVSELTPETVLDPNHPTYQKCNCENKNWTSCLVCDGCEQEFCLCCVGLSKVPAVDPWFCPTCANVLREATERGQRADAIRKYDPDGPVTWESNATMLTVGTKVEAVDKLNLWYAALPHDLSPSEPTCLSSFCCKAAAIVSVPGVFFDIHIVKRSECCVALIGLFVIVIGS